MSEKNRWWNNLPWIFPIYVNSYGELARPFEHPDSCSIIPSAPVASTIFFTFLANNFMFPSVLAASENPAVSPQPPIATIIAVPGANFDRTSLTVVKKGQDVGISWLNFEDCIKAIATCVMSSTSEGSGTKLCCLGGTLARYGKGETLEGYLPSQIHDVSCTRWASDCGDSWHDLEELHVESSLEIWR